MSTLRKKIFLCIFLILILSGTVYAKSKSIIINGLEISSDKPILEQNGITLVPLRVVSDGLGAQTLWDSKEKSIAIIKDNYIVFMVVDTNLVCKVDTNKIDISTFDINKDYDKVEIKEVSVAPKIINGTTMVPLRVISENLDCIVSYDQYSITINSASNNSNKMTTNTNLPNNQSSSLKNDAESIKKYLKTNYSVCSTDIGNISMNFEILENTSRNYPDDYSIFIDLNATSYYELQYGKNVSDTTSNKVKSQLKAHMEKLGKDLCGKLPNVKFRGFYDESYYEYPNLKLDYHLIYFCSWKNYTGDLTTDYNSAKLTGFMWDTKLDKEIW